MMFTVKLVRYKNAPDSPATEEHTSLRHAKTVHVGYETGGRRFVQLGDAPGEAESYTIGVHECQFNVAYVMNENGRTVERIG